MTDYQQFLNLENQAQMTEQEQMLALGLPCAFLSSSKCKPKKARKQQNQAPIQRSDSMNRGKSRLFSKWPEFRKEGIFIDNDIEMLYSITPEEVAAKIANYCKEKTDYTVLIDGFVGVGGNLVQFAIANPNAYIIGIDTNFERLISAKKIAELYNVSHQCEFICGDFLKSSLYIQFKPDIVFLSPPWGGKRYKKIKNYRLSDLDIDGYKAFHVANEMSHNIVYYLPVKTDSNDLDTLQEDFSRQTNKTDGLGATLCVYFGDLIDEDRRRSLQNNNNSTLNGSSGKENSYSFSTANSSFFSDLNLNKSLSSFNGSLEDFDVLMTKHSDYIYDSKFQPDCNEACKNEELPIKINKAIKDRCNLA